MKNIRLLCLGMVLMLAGCHTAGRSLHPFNAPAYNIAKPWRGDRFANDKKSFQFVVIADRAGGNRPGVFEQTIHKINRLQPEFVLSVGDYIEGKTEDDSLLAAEWDGFFKVLEPLQMPFFCLPGNHDISNPFMEQAYIDRMGMSYYHFVYGDVLFLCLNTEDPPPTHISESQIQYMEKALRDNQKVSWTMVLLHKPMWKYKDSAGYEKIEALLAGRPHTVIAAHEHRYQKETRRGIDHYVLATTGGSSALRGAAFGEMDHIVWITMTENGPVLANLAVEGIYGDNLRDQTP